MKKIIALLLALTLVVGLAACSNKEPDPSTDPSASPSASQTPAIVADLSQDVLTFAAGDLAKEKTLLTVDGIDIPTSRFLYWLAFSCSYFESTYYYYGLTVKDYAAYILSDSCSMAAYYALLEQKCLENGCPLTDDQVAAIAKEFADDPDTFEQRKTLYGLTDEDMEFIYAVEDYYNNLLNALTEEPTDEDLNDYVYQAKHILIKTVDTDQDPVADEEGNYSYPPLDEETVQKQTDLAKDILAQLQAAQPGRDLEELFDKLMNEYSEDGRDAEGKLAAPDGYTTTIGKMVPEFDAGALSLEPGQVSGLVESMYGYHIILRGEVEDIEKYAEEYRALAMDELVNEWLAEVTITPSEKLEELDVADFYTRYVTWQNAMMEKIQSEQNVQDK